MRPKLSTLTIVLSLAVVPLSAWADWPQFQGPDRDGRSSKQGIARSWPRSGPNELWKVDVGVGFGGAAIHGGQVFILDRRNDEEDVLRCFGLEDGKQAWEVPFSAPGRVSYNGSRQVPTVTDSKVFAAGPFGDLYAVDRKTQKVLWRRNLRSDFKAPRPNFGFSQSPLLYNNTVIFAPCSRSAGVVALDQSSGETIWSSPSIGGGGHSTATLAKIGGVDQVLFLTGGQLAAVDAGSGKTLWSHSGYRNRNPIPFPTILEDGRIFLTGGYNGGSAMIKVEKSGAEFKVQALSRMQRQGSQIHPALFHEGYLYANFNENSNLGGRRRQGNPLGLVCVDLEGNMLWKTAANPGIERGGLLLVDGMLISLGGQDGVLRLIEPNPKGYKELATAKVFSSEELRGSQLWAPMAITDGKLVLRSQRVLKCLDLKGGGSQKKDGKKGRVRRF